jgi:predicted lipoprotein with Yx(FWY)xxD motif
MPRLFSMIFAILSIIVANAHAQTGAPGKVVEVKPAVVDQKGLTLYVSDADRDGQPYCVKICTTQWHPLIARDGEKAEGEWTLATRDDGSKQWAYKGRPVYTWYRDKSPGQAQGDGSDGNRWHIARP